MLQIPFYKIQIFFCKSEKVNQKRQLSVQIIITRVTVFVFANTSKIAFVISNLFHIYEGHYWMWKKLLKLTIVHGSAVTTNLPFNCKAISGTNPG